MLVETGAGAGDEAYHEVDATIVATPAEIFAAAEMIVKVKEPHTAERAMLREGQMLYTYLHLAPDLGWKEALWRDHNLLLGLNVWDGHVTCAEVADEHGVNVANPEQAVA